MDSKKHLECCSTHIYDYSVSSLLLVITLDLTKVVKNQKIELYHITVDETIAKEY